MIPYNLLPAKYQKSAFIAGGYAACPALAQDIDVWVTVPQDELDEPRAAILQHLREHGFVFEEQTDRRIEQTTMPAGYEMNIAIRKVAKVSHCRSEQQWHILVTEGDVDQVLGSFDVSTHQVAITPYGVVCGENWTPTDVWPRRLKDTPTTNDRLRRIALRFGHWDFVPPISTYSKSVL